ncbi:phage tail assembly protein [Burkholderia sp. 9775_39]|uniref:phage tail assembly protein n=1 Tax=unclassified Burkholderia TaxID=2613784 RepID=UPI0018C402C8|nr:MULTISPECIES: phage tail assembly protein [unclassified Burkholderia]MBG0879430.1 phage tail assembly protein [Burkholderia sp. 9775_39]MBG0884571.1 phage tail assembly protein [Burkholderia sp. 9773_38]
MEENEKKPRKIQPSTITIELSEPITLSGKDGDTVHTELELREPNLRQVKAFVKMAPTKGVIEAFQALISEQTGIPVLSIDKIAVSDYYKAQEYLSFFLTPPDEDDPEGNEGGSR